MGRGIEIRWSKKALNQVRKIGEYIETDAPWQAERVVNLIFHCPQRLSFSKGIGKIVHEFGDPHLRELSVFSYRVIYRIQQENVVEIVAVVHGRQLLREDLITGYM
jgi:plasmid stabilization system protein ParE